MRTVADYLAKIPPEHASDANYMAELAAVLQPFVDAQAFIYSLPSLFDLDTATGVQLDATGAWIGQSRQVPVPIVNPWFSLDIDNLGADQGYWFGPYDGVGLASLDDDTYRRLLYAVRLANACDGALASIAAVLNTYFTNPATFVFVADDTDFPSGNWTTMNLSMTIGVAGQLPNVVDLSLLEQVLAPRIKAAGVEIGWAVTTTNGDPVFGLDVDNDMIGGLDESSWGANPDFVIENVILA